MEGVGKRQENGRMKGMRKGIKKSRGRKGYGKVNRREGRKAFYTFY